MWMGRGMEEQAVTGLDRQLFDTIETAVYVVLQIVVMTLL
jgi:hypothetical protein